MAELKTHEIPPQQCSCGYRLECGSGIDIPAPAEGDLSICWGCGQVMEFTPDLRLRALSDDEIAALPPIMRRQLRAYQAVHMVRKLRGL